MLKRLLICVLLFALLLALPFYFRKSDPLPPPPQDSDTLVIITAHNKTIRDEYEIAFRRYYKEKTGRDIQIDFRSPGGTSDIVRYIEANFRAEFRRYYNAHPVAGAWQDAFYERFANARGGNDPVRQLFLDSEIGIGIDVFAGGGIFDQSRMAQSGYAVAGKVRERHPEYFANGVIPEFFGGEQLCDPQGRYYGVVLSTFGIICNLDRLRELRDSSLPSRWSDLGEARFFNQLILADPTKSGSANKCYEIIIQQCMAEVPTPAEGWKNGLALLKKLFANARTVTDSASKVVHDVGIGEASCGTAIDTYGFSEEEWSAHCFNGKSKVRYVTPRGGTAVSADPVQILRGAPHRKVAELFVDFMLSPEGQKLHAYRAGIPGGPRHTTLNRSPIRRDLYAPEFRQNFFRPDYAPYESGADFTYRPELTGRYYELLRILIKATMLDVQPELRLAWKAIIDAGGEKAVPLAYQTFCQLPVTYAEAAEAAKKLKAGGKGKAAETAALTRSWSDRARKSYLEAAKLAAEGK